MFSGRPGRQGESLTSDAARRGQGPLHSLGSSYEAITGRLNGLSTLAGNWPALVLIQTAAIAAGGSERFVKLALASQSAAIVLLLIVMLKLKRNLAGRWQLVASCETAAVGVGIAGFESNKLTLFFGVLVSCWVSYAASTLRTALSPRAGDAAPRAQGGVQNTMYLTVFVASLVYVAIGENPTGWRIATALLAAALAVEGVRLAFVKAGTLPDPTDEPQPGLHQSVRKIFRFYPVMWAMLILTAMYVMLGLYFTDAQTELFQLGWRTSFASWMVAGIGGSRVLTLSMSRWMTKVGEEHHGTALVWSALIVVIAAALALWPLLGPGPVTGAVALAAAGVLLQAAMNGSNPIIRAYIGTRSADASTLVNIGAAGGQAIGTQIAAAVSWLGVTVGWGFSAGVILGLAIWTTLHRYPAHRYGNTETPSPPPDLPASNHYWLRGTPISDRRLRFRIRAGGADPLPPGYEERPPRDVGPGEIIRFVVPFDDTMEHEYWQPDGQVKFSSFKHPMSLSEWLYRREHRHARLRVRRHNHPPSSHRTPLLLLTGNRIEDCVTFDEDARRWHINTEQAKPVTCVLASGVRRWHGRVPFVATDGLVRGTVTDHRATSWQIVDRLRRPQSPVRTKTSTLPVKEIIDPKLADAAGGRWLLPVDALEGVDHEIVTELHFDSPRPATYLDPRGRHT